MDEYELPYEFSVNDLPKLLELGMAVEDTEIELNEAQAQLVDALVHLEDRNLDSLAKEEVVRSIIGAILAIDEIQDQETLVEFDDITETDGDTEYKLPKAEMVLEHRSVSNE